jgi:Leucine-rich repeat (LRR) protein
MLLHRVAKFATYLTRFDVFGASMDENLHSLINDTVINYLITREDINKSYFQYVDAFTENKFSCELVRLSLPECNTITPIGFGILSSSDDIRNKLLYLDVSGSYAVTDTILKEHISKFSSLKELKLSRCHYVSYPHIEELQSLTSLDMCGMKNVQDFSPINKLVQLRTLRLSNCPHLNDLSMLSDLSHLQVLDVNDTSIARLYHTSLTELNIGHCRLLEDPNELLPLQNITKLNMSYSYLNEGLFELCMWSRLVSLIMREADKKLLAPLNQFLVGTPLLEEIDLYRCDVGDKLINSIANNCPRMRKLSIMYCSNVTNVDSLRVLDQLVELNVSYTSVMSSHFFDMVSQMPSMNKLHVHGADANLAAALVSRLARSGRIITVLCEK